MAKTRSQTGHISIKKEEEEEDCKDNLLLNGVSNTTKKRAKITKPKPSKSFPDQQVKVEEDTDTKSLLKSSSKCTATPTISQEQINRLIDYIVNHKKSVREASCKLNVSMNSGYRYYNLYKNDPEKKIPSPRNRVMCPQRVYTQEQIGNLIRHIVDDKMTIKEAAAKQDLNYGASKYFYKKYLDDPDHNIPIPKLKKYYTQDQRSEFIGYIVNDKMTISAASRKAKMSVAGGYGNYHEYFDVQNPAPSHIISRKNYTQEQIRELIRCIVDDKMTIRAASRKVKMNQKTAGKYYRQYLKDNNMEILVSKCRKRYTQDRIDELVGYIDNDKMTIKEASKKANMNYSTGRKYYYQYLKQHNLDLPTPKYITRDQIDELIGYIINNKMTISAASKKVNIDSTSAGVYYHRYLKDNNMEIPVSKFSKRYTQDEINQLIGYIVNDKMSIRAASNKANVNRSTGQKYYRQYLKQHNLDIPTPQDQIDQLVGYTVDDKMTLKAASKKKKSFYQ